MVLPHISLEPSLFLASNRDGTLAVSRIYVSYGVLSYGYASIAMSGDLITDSFRLEKGAAPYFMKENGRSHQSGLRR